MTRSNGLVWRNREGRIFIKIAFVGEGGVGRTTLGYRIKYGFFSADTIMDPMVRFFTQSIMLNGQEINILLVDLTGQRRWRFFQAELLKGINAAVFTFDLTRPLTLENIGEWVDMCRSIDPEIPIIMVGFKKDLVDEIMVDDYYIEEFRDHYKFLDYMAISSKTGENVNKLLSTLYDLVLEPSQRDALLQNLSVNQELEAKQEEERKKNQLLRETELKRIENEIKSIKQEKIIVQPDYELRMFFKELEIKEKERLRQEQAKREKIINLKKAILDLGSKYARLEIVEISEECDAEQDLIESVVEEMITNGTIHAKYFKSTKSIVFDQRANVEEIDKLMASFSNWEKGSIKKKREIE